jgi:hypothetical protein
MSTDNIKTLAIGLLSLPGRHCHHEGLLEAAVRSAIATYSAMQPRLVAETCTCEGQAITDEQGTGVEYLLPLSSSCGYAVKIVIAGEQYRHRILSCSTSAATLRVYGAPAGTQTLVIWHAGAHDPAIPTWPPPHEALIALMTASFYLNALSLQEEDVQRAELIQSLAASYYGRAVTTLSQIT